jgi:hypothetical protein
MTLKPLALALLLPLALGACSTFRGGSQSPDELAVAREAPLTMPPDFTLRPPRPGAPRPQAVDAQGQAIEALFGPGAQVPPKSAGEQALLNRAGANRVSADIRSIVRDDGTEVVDKGTTMKDILDAPVAGSVEGGVVAIRKPGA